MAIMTATHKKIKDTNKKLEREVTYLQDNMEYVLKSIEKLASMKFSSKPVTDDLSEAVSSIDMFNKTQMLINKEYVVAGKSIKEGIKAVADSAIEYRASFFKKLNQFYMNKNILLYNVKNVAGEDSNIYEYLQRY